MKEYKSADSGVDIACVVQIVFLILKLLGIIEWKWIWVVSPTWISLVIGLLLLGLSFLLRIIIRRF